jgi:hypothetical protein
MVRREDRLARVAECASGTEVEVEPGLLLWRSKILRGAHIHRWGANTHRRRALSRGHGAGTVGLRTEIFVVGFCVPIFGKRDGAVGTDTARGDIAGSVAENIALQVRQYEIDQMRLTRGLRRLR